MKKLLIILAAMFMLWSVEPPAIASPEAKSTEKQQIIERYKQEEATFIVVYHAPWCGWCTRFKPVMDEVTSKHGIPVIRVDITKDASPDRVKGLPSFDLYARGKFISMEVGYKDAKALEELLLTKLPLVKAQE